MEYNISVINCHHNSFSFAFLSAIIAIMYVLVFMRTTFTDFWIRLSDRKVYSIQFRLQCRGKSFISHEKKYTKLCVHRIRIEHVYESVCTHGGQAEHLNLFITISFTARRGCGVVNEGNVFFMFKTT